MHLFIVQVELLDHHLVCALLISITHFYFIGLDCVSLIRVGLELVKLGLL
jgi:hypothetical protein